MFISFFKTPKSIILSIGLLTFIFGFAAGAILNLYYYCISNPLVLNYRSALTFKSAIYGDGLVLPLINMVAASFLLKKKGKINKFVIILSLVCGGLVTAYFHISQAVNNLVNWAMPVPWQWNNLGIFHAFFMYSVSTFLSLYFIVFFKDLIQVKKFDKSFIIVISGLIIFFILLSADYW